MPETKIEILRCPWGDTTDSLMRDYHDNEWGKPCFDERKLFEMLILEGAQAGLSWSCVLNKRENYCVAFDNWDIQKIANYDENKIAELLQNSGIIRNKLKINSTIGNAKCVLELGSLSEFIWNYVDGKQIVNYWERQEQMPAKSLLSDKISKDMKKLGFKFVGSTIIYSYLQAIGIINDHMESCSFRELDGTQATIENDIDIYIASQPVHLQAILLNVRLAIRKVLPNATEKISWRMPTFWQGRNLIHFAAQKNHLGIYPGAAAMEHFAPRLAQYKTSKGAVQFPYKTFGPEQLALISEIATWCGKELAKI